jgi:calcineurin-like phosphoesterase family protein
MSAVRFIADLHFGHKWMAEHRGFHDVFYHDEHIIDCWNSVVNKKDIVYILGDITMESADHYYRLDAMNGRKKVVLGNHDDPRHVPELLKYVEEVSGMAKYKGIWLTHCPVHARELEFRVPRNIHGHIHEHVIMREQFELDNWGYRLDDIPDDRYHCVSCEQVDYKPKTLAELGITR